MHVMAKKCLGGITMIRINGSWVAGVFALLFVNACATGSSSSTATVTSSGGPSMQQAQQEAYNGPKARIAVNKFTNKSAQGRTPDRNRHVRHADHGAF